MIKNKRAGRKIFHYSPWLFLTFHQPPHFPPCFPCSPPQRIILKISILPNSKDSISQNLPLTPDNLTFHQPPTFLELSPSNIYIASLPFILVQPFHPPHLKKKNSTPPEKPPKNLPIILRRRWTSPVLTSLSSPPQTSPKI